MFATEGEVSEGNGYAIHPLVRVVCFLALSLFLSLGDWVHIFLTLLLLTPFWLATSWLPLRDALPLLRRMRWFFFSILLIYWWLTPGEPLWRGAPGRLPSVDGVTEGVHRVAVLVLLICALRLMLWQVPRDALVAAIYRLLWPLFLTGLSRERVAVRVVLILETVEHVQAIVHDAIADNRQRRSERLGLVDAAAAATAQVVARAELAPCHAVNINIGIQPPRWQWLIPAAIVLSMWAAGHL